MRRAARAALSSVTDSSMTKSASRTTRSGFTVFNPSTRTDDTRCAASLLSPNATFLCHAR